MKNTSAPSVFMTLAERMLVLVSLVLAMDVCGQPYFSRIYAGFRFNCAAITPDSGLVVGGGGTSIYAGRWLLRVDRDGTPLWTTAYTTSQAEPVWIFDVALIGDSSFILVGNAGAAYTTSNKMVQQVVGNGGEVLWGGKASGDGFDDTDYWLYRAERAPDGSVIVCGARLTMNLGGVFGPGYATRIGSEAGSYFTPFTSHASGPGLPVAVIKDVAATSDGGFVGLGFGGNGMIAYKVSALGIVVWSRSLAIGGDDLVQMHVVEGEVGITYVAAEAYNGNFRLMRLDSTGTVLWNRKYQVPGGPHDQPTGLIRFPNGDLWISGSSWLMACSSIGEVLWARTVPHVIVDMERTPEADGVFLIGREGDDGWLMRTDSTGQVPGCAGTSFVPIEISETLVSQPYSPPNANLGLSAYEAGVTVGQPPTTQTDCLVNAFQPSQASVQSFRAYPVPFTRLLNIELPASHDHVELIDAQGVIQRSMRTANERSIVLSREGLSPGLYLLRVMKAGRSVAVQRVIAE